MKIKRDFITNSSSTSFCCWGIEIEDYEFRENEKFLKKLYDNYVKVCKKLVIRIAYSYEEFKELKTWEIMENLGSMILNYDEDGEYVRIGGKCSNMDDKETLGEYKEKICRELNSYGFDVDVKDIFYIEFTSSD